MWSAGAFGRWELFLLPSRKDNYIYALRNASHDLMVVDPGEVAPVENFLKEHPSRLRFILLTHHHADHIAGAEELRTRYGALLIGAAADRHRLPPLDREVTDGDRLHLLEEKVEVLAIPGHTLGHIAFFLPESKLLFCGDTLFSLGCGRLFEGTPAQMLSSLTRLAALPEDTAVCCGHEYTLANARFAMTVEPENAALAEMAKEVGTSLMAGHPTLPSTLAQEKRANPFLRVNGDVEAFARLRLQKDVYQ